MASCGGIFDYAGKVELLEEFEIATADPSFWNDNDKAQKTLREQATIKKLVGEIDEAQTALDDGRELPLDWDTLVEDEGRLTGIVSSMDLLRGFVAPQ